MTTVTEMWAWLGAHLAITILTVLSTAFSLRCLQKWTWTGLGVPLELIVDGTAFLFATKLIDESRKSTDQDVQFTMGGVGLIVIVATVVTVYRRLAAIGSEGERPVLAESAANLPVAILPCGVKTTAYRETVHIISIPPTATVSWNVLGALPPGLALCDQKGSSITIAGTPSQEGTFVFHLHCCSVAPLPPPPTGALTVGPTIQTRFTGEYRVVIH